MAGWAYETFPGYTGYMVWVAQAIRWVVQAIWLVAWAKWLKIDNSAQLRLGSDLAKIIFTRDYLKTGKVFVVFRNIYQLVIKMLGFELSWAHCDFS